MVEFVVVLGFGALLPVLPLYVVEHGIDVPTLGVITAAWAIAKLVSEPLFGYLADRTSRRPIMVAGMALFGVFTILPVFFTSALALFVLRLAAGAAAGMYDPAARGTIVDATHEGERGEAFGLYGAFAMGGLLLGPVIGSIGIVLGGGYGFPFILTGVLALASAVYLWFALPARGRAMDPRSDMESGEVADLPVEQAPLRALANRVLIAAVLMNLGFAFAVGVYEVAWSLYLTVLGASIEWIGFTFTLFGLPVLVLSPFAGRLIDRRGGLAFAAGGGLVIAACGVLYAISTEPVFPAVVILIEATATAFVTPALYALLAKGTPTGRSATAQGVFGASLQIGVIVASLFAGRLFAIDPRWPFYFFVVITAASVVLGLMVAWGARPVARTARKGSGAALATVLLCGCVAVSPPASAPASGTDATPASPSAASTDPGATPSASATVEPPPAASVSLRPTAQTYTIRGGDSLSSIAAQFGLTVGQLLAANPQIADPNDIRAGDVLVIPPQDAPTGLPSAGEVIDATSDVVDGADQPVFAPGYTDITSLEARVDADTLFIELLTVSPPPIVDPAAEEIEITVTIDVDDDDDPDFRLVLSNALSPTLDYAATVTDLDSGATSPVGSFPGVFTFEPTIRFEVPRASLRNSRRYAVAATIERRFAPGGPSDSIVDAAIDRAPDQQWPRPNPRWLEVGVG